VLEKKPAFAFIAQELQSMIAPLIRRAGEKTIKRYRSVDVVLSHDNFRTPQNLFVGATTQSGIDHNG